MVAAIIARLAALVLRCKEGKEGWDVDRGMERDIKQKSADRRSVASRQCGKLQGRFEKGYIRHVLDACSSSTSITARNPHTEKRSAVLN